MFTCGLFGLSRQVYYRKVKSMRQKRDKAAQVVDMVMRVRQALPRLGSRKLYFMLFEELQALKIGRDKFFDILRANHLLIKPKRSYHVTTCSHHRFRKHRNLIEGMKIERPEQVWVSDITYIGKREKPCYLSLVTDAYSKKIIGYHVADNLHTESSLMALKMAIRQRSHKTLSLIHHSDRGIQYCSDDYQKALAKNHISCSMTNNGDPYENAIAERINGILKQEFGIDRYHKDIKLMRSVVEEAIKLYNDQRPHYSNYLLTPTQMHLQCELQMRTYKKGSSKSCFTTA